LVACVASVLQFRSGVVVVFFFSFEMVVVV
jgi:hypothetical protein